MMGSGGNAPIAYYPETKSRSWSSMENWQETIQDAVASYGPPALGFLSILVIGWMGAKFVTGLEAISIRRP